MPISHTAEYIQSLIKSHRLGDQVTSHRYISGHPARMHSVSKGWDKQILQLLKRLKIKRLYSHQIDALEAIRRKEHTVVATPTASGKSLIYNLYLFETLAVDQQARGLYIFPLKALTQDQLKTFDRWARAADPLAAKAAVYDGDTSAYRRKKIRQDPPNVVMTNPEMVHMALLAYHPKWQPFFKNLKIVVIDEVHSYRGLMGAHMSRVLRRLRRVCAHYGSTPTFVFTSATVANPGHLASQLTGLQVSTITQNGAPLGGRHLVLMNPLEGPAHTAILLLKAAMARKLRTIVYTQSRKLAELITLWVRQQAGKLAEKINVYRAGLLPQERREIEKKLKQGQLLAVVATSALELGIDIGDLDICILVGYPGSMISTWQRSGRVGRQGQESALIMIAAQDALDQYYITHPKAFFEGEPESAVVNPYNPVVLASHLKCAAAELALHTDEKWLTMPDVDKVLKTLMNEGELLISADGKQFHCRQRRPHLKVDLRSAGERYRIYLKNLETTIGEINGFRLYHEAHPGAVYLHQGQPYLVSKVDESTKTVIVRPSKVDYHTRVRSDTDVSIIDIYEGIYIGKTNAYAGKLKVTSKVTGYEKVRTRNGQAMGHFPLDLPPVIFETDGVWFRVGDPICRMASDQGYDLLGALHAAEHAAISIMPLVVLADRNDLGGLATPFHPQTNEATIFIYDGVPGGAGLSRQAFQEAEHVLGAAQAAIARCNCDNGCPACVHSPKCGSGNHPMDKAGGKFLLQEMMKPGGSQSRVAVPRQHTQKSPKTLRKVNKKPLRYGVFDLETQRSAKQVGGWHMAHRMRISCGVVYDVKDDSFAVYMENQVDQLIEHLLKLDLVVGFNSKLFDYQVLSRYSQFDFNQMPALDLLEQVHKTLGFRLSLDHLATETLNVSKSGSGLDALRWWQEGRIDKIIDYCRMDVKVTRNLYLFARDNGYLIYKQKSGDRFRVPIRVHF